MGKADTHIISKFRWDTVFDSRERAFELQERLSDWSRAHLEREVTNVFNRLCPADQSWNIGSLEINLGVIDFNNLEAELTEKIGRCIAEKLTEQVIYAKTGNANIEITSKDISVIEMLNSFFLSGVLPWNSNTDGVSVNELLAEQLRTNFRNVINWLIEAGATGREVRKRMAWQISEPNLGKILGGLEPNNFTQIIDFKNELAAIQEKERVVQTGSAEFRKNLWFWILNYLYAERGSVFNKISFLKSSIRQMADHYNVGYDELFKMIEEAIENIEISSNVHPGFIMILKALSKEKTAAEAGITEETPDYWHILEQLLKGNPVHSYQSAGILDELVVNLSRQDNDRFSKLIASLNLSLSVWASVAAVLKDTSLETIVCAQDIKRAAFIIEAIYFLEKLCREQNIAINRPLLWAMGIRNLRQNKEAETGNRLFMMDCILCLGKTNQVSWEKMLLQLVGARIPALCKTGTAIDVFTALNDVFLIEISNRPPSFFNNRFTELAGSFYKLLDNVDSKHETFISLQQSLRKYIQLYPSGALELLVQYAGKEKIQKLFANLADNHTAGLLLQHAAAGFYYPVLTALQKQLKKFGNSHLSVQMSRFVENHLMNTGLRLAVLFPAADRDTFITRLFKELLLILPHSLHQQFRAFMAMLVSEGDSAALALTHATIEKIIYHPVLQHDEFLLEHVKALMQHGTHKRGEVAGILYSNFTRQPFAAIRKTNGAEALLLTEYLVTGAGKIMEDITDEYLRELFWKCLLDTSAHRGNSERFKNRFSRILHAYFPVANTEKDGVVSLTTTDGDEPSYAEILRLLRECFENCETTIIYKRKNISLKELIGIVRDIDAGALSRVISAMSFSEKQEDFISTVFSFSELSTCLMDQGEEFISIALEDLRLLFHLNTSSETNTAGEALEKEFVRHAVSLLANSEWPGKDLSRVTLPEGMSAKQVASSIKENGCIPSAGLRAALVNRMPALASLLPEQVVNSEYERLKKVNRKGLLEELIRSLLMQQQVPLWFVLQDRGEAGDLLNQILMYYPVLFSRVFRRENIDDTQLRWFEMSIDTAILFDSIARSHSKQRLLIKTVQDLYRSVENIMIKGISGHELQALLFKKIMFAWTTDNWDSLSATQIWNELAWDICLKTGLTKRDFLSGVSQYKSMFPVSLQVSMEQYKESPLQHPAAGKQSPARKPFKYPNTPSLSEPVLGEGIAIRNAGLVLLSSYIPLLFERLGIISDGQFINAPAQNDAVHYLQYLATGAYSTEEFLLPLNKIICGLDLPQPVTDGVIMEPGQKEIMDGLIYGVINHWPDAGSNSADGLRGNWLVRNGILREEENGWDLTVERKPYDLLLTKAPFSFSFIKFPWMPKQLTVKWRF